MGALLLGCGVTVAVLGTLGWVLATADSAPTITQLSPRVPGQLSQVYASNGQRLGYIAADVLRSYVAQNQMPELLRQATVAVEDRRFYEHGGVDRRTASALRFDLIAYGILEERDAIRSCPD